MANKSNKYNAPTLITKLIKYLNKVLILGVFYCGKSTTTQFTAANSTVVVYILSLYIPLQYHTMLTVYFICRLLLIYHAISCRDRVQQLTSTFISLTLLTLNLSGLDLGLGFGKIIGSRSRSRSRSRRLWSRLHHWSEPFFGFQ